MEIQENVALAPYTTFGIGGPARWFAQATAPADVPTAVEWARSRGVPLFVLGGGSNVLVPDSGYNGLVLHMNNRGIEQGKLSSPEFLVAAGEPWDDFVQLAVDRDRAGIECLAGIPGSTGGTPVQNVGAYGQEVAQTIREVHVFDTETMQFRWMSADECRFRYRESVFNTVMRGRCIVTEVVFALNHGKPNLTYAELARRFEGRGTAPDVREVAAAVRAIRSGKGMLLVDGDADCRSAGSYFKNPVVSDTQAEHVAAAAGRRLDEIAHWPAGAGRTKLAAAWLLEQAGFGKGYGRGPARISGKHTLALTNRGGAHLSDVLALQQEIVAGVESRFGVRLEREPVLMQSGVAG